MAVSYSPLRYPGGKSKLLPLFANLVDISHYDCYIEPFAGGAGVAIGLIISQKVKRVIINDYDIAIYSFWKALLDEQEWFLNKIIETPVTINEWQQQREIYLTSNDYSKELGFATFFLNRTNHSGILKAGPIGGIRQEGRWKIDARFNKEYLIKKIIQIYKYKDNIEFYQLEVRDFIDYINKKKINNAFVYLDPPYFNKGQQLYKNFFNSKDHEEISKKVGSLKYDWVVTYDNDPFIKNLYKKYWQGEFSLNYSLSVKRKATEFIAFSNKKVYLNVVNNKDFHFIFTE